MKISSGQAIPNDLASMKFERYAMYEEGVHKVRVAPFFSWTIYRSPPTDPYERAVREAKTQHGERLEVPRMGFRRGTMVRIGGVRVKRGDQVADRVLNKRARQALIDLSKRWGKQ